MSLLDKLEKAIVFMMRDIISVISPAKCTKFMVRYYRRKGMKINGEPNYISAKVWFDGTDYSMIELNHGCTISSFVRILTHDWSPYTAAKGLGLKIDKPIGIFRPVKIGRYAFIGTGSILLPGAEIGEGAIVGAGSVVRGPVSPWTIVTGSPAKPIGDSREFVYKNLKRLNLTELVEQVEKVIKDGSKGQ